MTIEEKARIFAVAAHSAVGQLRKYTQEPYWLHPQEVAAIVAGVPGATPEMIAAAYLHDTVEDTEVTLELIRAEFGDEVATLVGWLTDVSGPDHGNRAARKAVDRAHIAAAPAEAQTVKCADVISNVSSIREHDEQFAVVYLREKKQLLEVMRLADPQLLERLRAEIGSR